LGIMVAFIVFYACAYFHWVPEVPLKNLLFGTSQAGDAAEQRISITHQLGGLGSELPWVFRFWRGIIQNWPVAVCFILAYKKATGGKISSVLYYPCVLGTAWLLTFTLEKASLVEFVFGLAVIPMMVKRKTQYIRLAASVGVVTLLSMACIAVFIRPETSGVFKALTNRLNGQTSSIYVQIQHVREQGYLGLRGIKFPFESWILGKDYYISLSTEAYAAIFPEMARAGYVGSAGGLSLAELYFAFGWFGLPIFVLLVGILSWMDIVWRNSITLSSRGEGFRCINGAFYVLGMTLYSLTYVGSLFMIVSFPFGLSAECLLIAILYFWLIKASSLRLVALGRT